MKRYVQFYRSSDAEMLGSDGIMNIDGRYGRVKCIELAKEQAKKIMENLGKTIVGYELRMYKNDMFRHYIVVERGEI